MENYEVELTRNNVTPGQFFAAIRSHCKQKGIVIGIDLQEFKKPSIEHDSYYIVNDGIKTVYNNGHKMEFPGTDTPCKSEVARTKPYEVQTYIKNFDGSTYNEIIEFTFTDDKKGTGYYYLLNKN